MPFPLLPLLWPAASLLACLRQMAAASGIDGLGGAAPASLPPPAGGRSERATASFVSVESAATALGIEADPAAIPWHELPQALARAGPALIEIRGERPGFLALLAAGGRRRVTLLGPDGRRHGLPASIRFSSASGFPRPASRWRVVVEPQLHANHVFAESLAFNLLVGRGWPPSDRDLEEAEEVCRDLGLGPLLDHLPGGLEQRVGEAGWQLSHGEAARFAWRVLCSRNLTC